MINSPRSNEQVQDKILEQIMKQSIYVVMLAPTVSQRYDHVCFKLGAFYKRFWETKNQGIKSNTRKAGEIVAMAENMKQIQRDINRQIRLFAYARQLKKFQFGKYKQWKEYMWKDLQPKEKTMIQNYVENLTPPEHFPGESEKLYKDREQERLSLIYKQITFSMVLVEVFDKIWTIKNYKKKQRNDDVARHQNLAREMFGQLQKRIPNLKNNLQTKLAPEQWTIIQHLF